MAGKKSSLLLSKASSVQPLSHYEPKTIEQRIRTSCEKLENHICSECSNTQPTWAAFLTSPVDGKRLGVLCCMACCSLYIKVGEGQFTLRNTRAVHQWTEHNVEALETCGNESMKSIYDANSKGEKAECEKFPQGREAYFFEKYVNLRFFSAKVYREVMAQHLQQKAFEANKPKAPTAQEEKSSHLRDLKESARQRASSSRNEENRSSRSLKQPSSRRNISELMDDDKATKRRSANGGRLRGSSSKTGLLDARGERRRIKKSSSGRDSTGMLTELPIKYQETNTSTS